MKSWCPKCGRVFEIQQPSFCRHWIAATAPMAAGKVEPLPRWHPLFVEIEAA